VFLPADHCLPNQGREREVTVGQPTITLDSTQAITFPSAVPLASLNPFAPVLVPPILVVILGVNAQQ